MSDPTVDRPLGPLASSRRPLFALALLRIGIGWHLAYEGLTKLLDPGWTSAGYLRTAEWMGADVFRAIAEDGFWLPIVDQLNIWGLLLIGTALMLGLLTRVAAAAGIVLLGLYYMAHPPLFAPTSVPLEGNYLIVNKNVVEMLALLVVALLPATRLGLDRYALAIWRRVTRGFGNAGVPGDSREPVSARDLPTLARRQALTGLLGMPVVGAFVMAVLQKHGYRSEEERQLAGSTRVVTDATSGATEKYQWDTLEQLQGQVPTARLGNVELSRLVMGGNLMNGFAHARDLIYVSKLIKAYHDRDKIFETFRLAEACGINTIITNPILAPAIVDYWEHGGGKIQFIAQCRGRDNRELLEILQYAVDNGACAAHIQGAAADTYVRTENFDSIAWALDRMRELGLPAGIGAHYLETVVACVERGIEPDFWMKTLHHHNYWSANLDGPDHDSIWCEKPDETIAYMADLPQPWIAFKVLAAGAIHPRVGFKHAFTHGADFICAGMYDFQVVEDANIAYELLAGDLPRQRPWRA